jgi:hypothetical protein
MAAIEREQFGYYGIIIIMIYFFILGEDQLNIAERLLFPSM